MDRIETLTIVLAGGKGTRLEPLTTDRAKPAVPFAGAYRIVDFALSNCLNSGLMRLLVLTQYKSLSLDRHIHRAWSRLFQRDLGQFLDILPPQQRVSDDWYLGTANAVFQNIYSIANAGPRLVLVLAGDHIYKMNYNPMLKFHKSHGGVATVAALPVPVNEAAGQFGVMEIDRQRRIVGFEEKPAAPRPIPDDPNICWASMGIYVFDAQALVSELTRETGKEGAIHDFGHHLLPRWIETQGVYAYPFQGDKSQGHEYWRDVGTVDAYYKANLETLGPEPPLDLHERNWPIISASPSLPPAKIAPAIRTAQGSQDYSTFCPGVLSAGDVRRSIVGYGCRIESGASVESSILLDGCEIGHGAVVRNAILDKGVCVAPGAQVGIDPAEDQRRGLTRSPQGVTCVPRSTTVASVERATSYFRRLGAR